MQNILLFSLSLLPTLALAADPSGRTADGCTYKVINGQYVTSCPQPTPVTSYSDVPMHQPSLQVQGGSAPSTVNVALGPPSQGQLLENREELERDHSQQRLLDRTYVGVFLGSNTVKEVGSGGALGLGVSLGSNIDENLGVELSYAYSKQDLYLGLASRGGGFAPYPTPSVSNTDSTLSSHLITAELQAHLTDAHRRFRPYLGLGLGWKGSTLEEDTSAIAASSAGYSSNSSGGSLRQSSFGTVGSAGAKLHLSRVLQLGLAFRYFLPISRQNARIEQPAPNYGEQYPSRSRLNQADDTLTGSSQYQMLGGLQYLF